MIIFRRDSHALLRLTDAAQRSANRSVSIMRVMKTRQATKWVITLLLFFTTYACSPSSQPIPTLTHLPPTSTPQQTLTPAPLSNISTATQAPLACLTQPGRVETGKLESTNPAQEYLIYLPPCYDEQTDQRYPVLYLLHGQTYTADQWIRLGAVDALDKLILSRKASPFIIVFPYDRYWYTETGSGFGDRVASALIPFIDDHYRTNP